MAQEMVINGVDYGPLACLVGTWKGDKGMDVSPEVEGKEESPYFETLMFEAIGTVTNAGKQVLAFLRYHQVVSRKVDQQAFHNETGYWMWDAEAGVVMHSLTIPRGVCVLAGGKVSGKTGSGPVVLEVQAALGDKDWGILQSPFMRDKARTTGFKHKITVEGGRLSYSETTTLEIYGRTFEHTDQNTLTRCST